MSGRQFRNPDQIRRAYESGLPGSPHDERAIDAFCSTQPGGGVFVKEVAPHLAGHGAGKRALLWRYREKHDPGAFAAEAQTTGDCVSHGDRNARDTTRCVEIELGNEPEEYFRRGATEPTYGARGHGGQGMSPARAAQYVRDTGWLGRENHESPNGNLDLRKYNANIGARWGRSGVPSWVKELCKAKRVGRYVRPTSVDEAKDLLASGYAGHSGQQIGFNATPDRHGISPRRGSWNHDMAIVGFDDTREHFPVCVFFVPNSWGQWNKKPSASQWPEELFGPWIPGMIVVHEDVFSQFVRAGDMWFYSDIGSYERRELPDWGFNY